MEYVVSYLINKLGDKCDLLFVLVCGGVGELVVI